MFAELNKNMKLADKLKQEALKTKQHKQRTLQEKQEAIKDKETEQAKNRLAYDIEIAFKICSEAAGNGYCYALLKDCYGPSICRLNLEPVTERLIEEGFKVERKWDQGYSDADIGNQPPYEYLEVSW